MTKDVSSASDQLHQSTSDNPSEKLATHVYSDLMPRFLSTSAVKPEPQMLNFDSVYSSGCGVPPTPMRWQTEPPQSEREVALQVMSFLTKKGLTPEEAAGLVGHFDFDTKLNPAFQGVGKELGYGGIADVNLQDEQAWANQQHLPYYTLATQMEYAWNQIKTAGGGNIAQQLFSHQNMTVAEATAFMAKNILRPPDLEGSMAARTQSANKILSWYRQDHPESETSVPKRS